MPRRVLLVEDDPLIRYLVEEILSDMGCEVAAEADAAGGLAAFAGDRAFRLAVVDLGLADGSGYAVIRAARALSPPVPVIVSTGDDAGPDEVERAAGPAAAPLVLLRKPWNVARFTAEVRRLSGAGTTPSASARAEEPAPAPSA